MGIEFKTKLNKLETKDILQELSSEDLAKLQKSLSDSFFDIYKVCEKNKINVFVVGGTSLGSIRHKGFIPWDDDLDIAMTRKDYEKFKNIFEKALGKTYILNSPNYSNNSITRFPKILKKNTIYKDIYSLDENLSKVFIDIFILDKIPENRIIRFIKGNYCNLLMFISGQVYLYKCRNEIVDTIYLRANKVLYYLKLLIGFVFSYKSYSEWNDIIDKSIKYDKNSKLFGLPTGRKHYFGEIFDESVIFPPKEAVFNNNKVLVFNDVDLYLKNLYGDYMKIPSENKREKHFIRELKL